jgi:Domain of unknown function (DUF1707)
MTERGEDTTAAGARGRIRASRLDRERVIELLKVAFVQGRLTQDELDTRVGQTLASRTYADLADLTADIPAEPTAGEPAAEPVSSAARTLAKAALRSGICLLVPFAVLGVAALTHAQSLLSLAIFLGIWAAVAAPGFLGYGIVDAWQERRSRRQLPPQARRDGTGLEPGPRGVTGRDPARPEARTDQTRADLRTHRPARHRWHPSGRSSRAPRCTRPIPGAV